MDAIANEDEPICGIAAHLHTEACDGQAPACEHEEDGCSDTWACTVEEHTHAEECYSSDAPEGPLSGEGEEAAADDGDFLDGEISMQPEGVLHQFRELLSTMSEVTLPVKIHVNDMSPSEETAYPLVAGRIADTAPQEMAYHSCYSKAVVRINGGETEIEYAGMIDGKVYFSLPHNPDVGILLTEGQEIVLYYIGMYAITYQYDDTMGSVGSSPESVTGSNSFAFHAAPNQYCHVAKVVAEKPDGTSTTIALDKHNDAVIRIESDLTIHVTFEPISTYHISTGYISNGHICSTCSHEANGNSFPLTAVPAGRDVTVVIWSAPSVALSVEWRLNMISINGEDVRVPSTYEKGVTATTVLSGGSIVTVTCTLVGKQSTPGTPRDPSAHGNSFYGTMLAGQCQWRYDVKITNAHSDLAISTNFKKDSLREIIIKGLRGIESTGAAWEDTYLGPIEAAGYHFKYSLREAPDTNVYTAFYRQRDAGSRNAYVYKVYPGYNPWTVSVEGVNTGARVAPNGVDGDEVYTVSDIVGAQTTDFRHWEAFSQSCAQKGYVYAFAFREYDNKNQWVYLNAMPYRYSMYLDLNGGTLTTPPGYSEIDGGQFVYGATYSVEDRDTYYLPGEVPTREGWLFTGWKLVTSAQIYGSNQMFAVATDAPAIVYATGNEKDNSGMRFTFEAQWAANPLDNEETDVYVEYYVMDSVGQYHRVEGQTGSYIGTVGSGAVYKGTVWTPPDDAGEYRLNTEVSVLSISELWARSAEGYQEHNTISYYYDCIVRYTVHHYRTGTEDSAVAEDTVVGGMAAGQVVTIYPQEVAGYTCTETSQTHRLEAESEFTFWYDPICYTLYFEPNGGAGAMDSQTLLYDAEYALPECGFTRDGHQFAGWSSTPEGGVEHLPQAVVSRLTSVPNGSYTLYAVWTERIDAVVPLWVCMYAYGGDGTVVAPDNYGIYNYSASDVQVEKLTIQNAWTLMPDSAISGGNRLKAGELYLRLNDVTLVSGEVNLRLNRSWRVPADSTAGGGTFFPVSIRAYIAAGARNESGEYPVVNVTYTLGPASGQ